MLVQSLHKFKYLEIRDETMEAKENAQVTLFTLSLPEENKIIIGGAILA